jgi:uncharacterized protein
MPKKQVNKKQLQKNSNSKKSESNTLAILTHLLGLITGFLGPLIILFVAEDEFTKKNAKTVLNWQFSLIIYFIVSFILILLIIGILLIIALVIMNTIFLIIGAIKASEGKVWKYPLSIPFFNI